jgi:orotate phosphoribosyltransferase
MLLETGKVIANILWETQAIQVSTSKPFQMTSGKYSPIYVDCRIPISHPVYRDIINTCAFWYCTKEGIETEVIAGGETAGMPFAAWLADKMGKPYIYVRKKPKGHGTGAQIGGRIHPGQSVLLYEDLITDGLSKLNFISAIRNSGGVIEHCAVILDRQQGGGQTLMNEGVHLHALSTINECLEIGLENQYLNQEQYEHVKNYLIKGAK